MPSYSYVAKSLGGKTQIGTAEVKDTYQLAQSLKADGLILVRADLEDVVEKGVINLSLPFFDRISLSEKILAVKNLQTMIGAGLPIFKAISIIANQAKSKKFKTVLIEIKNRLNKGESLSEATKNYPNVFSQLFVNMIKVGEEAGSLDDVLKILALQMEKEHMLKSKVKKAMVYPAIILCTMAVIGILMMIFVVPKITALYETLNAQLPLPTKILIFSVNFLISYWYLVIAASIFLIFSFFAFLRSKQGKQIFDTFVLKLPIIGPLTIKTGSASLVRSLSSLISAGVPIIDSLDIISGTLGNVYFEGAVLQAKEKVKKGEKLSQALRPSESYFSLGTLEMMEVGEETGETATILKKLAESYEEEVVVVTDGLSAAIEPVLMILIGIAVGFFAISVIGPIYSVIGSV